MVYRLCLNYKRLAYITEWVEYPDIQEHCERLGIAATGIKPDGSPYYTLPAIHDPSTGAYISESFSIAVYLDKTYPDTPPIFPNGTVGLQAPFVEVFTTKANRTWPFIFGRTCANLNPRSADYMSNKLKNLPSESKDEAESKQMWTQAREDMSTANEWYSAGGNKGPFMLGETLSWADIVVSAHFLCWKLLLGPDSQKWKDIESWDEGRWASLMTAVVKHTETGA